MGVTLYSCITSIAQMPRKRYYLRAKSSGCWQLFSINQCCHWGQSCSRLNLEIFTLHHCALNRGCSGWVSSFIIVCYDYVSGEVICPSTCVKSR